MSVWQEPTECALCEAKGHGIAYQLVEWVDALPGMRWAHVPRCDDRDACRARFIANAKANDEPEKWPVAERAA